MIGHFGLSFWEEVAYFWRVLTVSLGGFDIAFALYIGWLYFRGYLRSGIYHGGSHVAAIIGSYALLAAALVYVMSDRAIHGEPVTWRLPIATIAFALGAWALYQLVRARAKSK